ncbi:hypothetical protein BDY17DRAFT_328375 [Neohortaea acidophila]|uniref:Uncharacterized protein n=1 Tax=Neohortaea acidophila TaxID=245834 RepID=A0A6A6PGK8_9PEZI|nr:uncharacterized protein BDY17DRAFT_328375 [Neohortaea acidophila]KAF2478864.1 hypothetical protein BDY17DRAFT_328375 [Neohortaea acidophila]
MLLQLVFVFLLVQFCSVVIGSVTTVTKFIGVTETATVATHHGACESFTGLCFVLGPSAGPPSTTTVYETPAPPAPPQSTITTLTTSVISTTTDFATTSVPNSNACESFTGACVVYGTDQSTTTTFYATSTGNSHGDLGQKKNVGSGSISDLLQGACWLACGVIFAFAALL